MGLGRLYTISSVYDKTCQRHTRGENWRKNCPFISSIDKSYQIAVYYSKSSLEQIYSQTKSNENINLRSHLAFSNGKNQIQKYSRMMNNLNLTNISADYRQNSVAFEISKSVPNNFYHKRHVTFVLCQQCQKNDPLFISFLQDLMSFQLYKAGFHYDDFQMVQTSQIGSRYSKELSITNYSASKGLIVFDTTDEFKHGKENFLNQFTQMFSGIQSCVKMGNNFSLYNSQVLIVAVSDCLKQFAANYSEWAKESYNLMTNLVNTVFRTETIMRQSWTELNKTTKCIRIVEDSLRDQNGEEFDYLTHYTYESTQGFQDLNFQGSQFYKNYCGYFESQNQYQTTCGQQFWANNGQNQPIQQNQLNQEDQAAQLNNVQVGEGQPHQDADQRNQNQQQQQDQQVADFNYYQNCFSLAKKWVDQTQYIPTHQITMDARFVKLMESFYSNEQSNPFSQIFTESYVRFVCLQDQLSLCQGLGDSTDAYEEFLQSIDPLNTQLNLEEQKQHFIQQRTMQYLSFQFLEQLSGNDLQLSTVFRLFDFREKVTQNGQHVNRQNPTIHTIRNKLIEQKQTFVDQITLNYRCPIHCLIESTGHIGVFYSNLTFLGVQNDRLRLATLYQLLSLLRSGSLQSYVPALSYMKIVGQFACYMFDSFLNKFMDFVQTQIIDFQIFDMDQCLNYFQEIWRTYCCHFLFSKTFCFTFQDVRINEANSDEIKKTLDKITKSVNLQIDNMTAVIVDFHFNQFVFERVNFVIPELSVYKDQRCLECRAKEKPLQQPAQNHKQELLQIQMAVEEDQQPQDGTLARLNSVEDHIEQFNAYIDKTLDGQFQAFAIYDPERHKKDDTYAASLEEKEDLAKIQAAQQEACLKIGVFLDTNFKYMLSVFYDSLRGSNKGAPKKVRRKVGTVVQDKTHYRSMRQLYSVYRDLLQTLHSLSEITGIGVTEVKEVQRPDALKSIKLKVPDKEKATVHGVLIQQFKERRNMFSGLIKRAVEDTPKLKKEKQERHAIRQLQRIEEYKRGYKHAALVAGLQGSESRRQ